MRKNRTAYFLIIVFIIITGIFYKMISDRPKAIEVVKSKTLEYCKQNNYEDANIFISKELKENLNCSNGKPGTEGLGKLYKRILKVKLINSQESEKEFVDEIKYNYTVGSPKSLDKAESLFKEAFVKYPNSESLTKLSFLLKEEGRSIEAVSKTSNSGNSNVVISGSNKPKISSGRVPTTVVPESNQQIDEPVKLKKIIIPVDFQMSEQNKFTWNPDISSNGLTTTIVIQTGSGAKFQEDVTGSSSFKFKGDNRFDGVTSKVRLIIQNKEGVEVKGSKELTVKTTC